MTGYSYWTPIWASRPAAIELSTGLTEEACTRTTTWLSAGIGSGRSSRSRGAASGLSSVIARIVVSFGGRRHQRPEQGEGFSRSGAGLGGVGVDGQVGVQDDIEAVVAELHVADVRVVEALDPAEVEADVVAGPVLAELVAASGELADEVGEGSVVGLAPRSRPQGADDVAGDGVPV